MPRFDRSGVAQGPVVGGFSADGFAVDGGIYRALLLTPLRAEGWDPPPIEELAITMLEPLLTLEPKPEFLILGTGATHRFPPRSLVADLDERGVGVETMDSRAAARTWGLLRSEERWIVAALMPLV